jgi:hypothetical protein
MYLYSRRSHGKVLVWTEESPVTEYADAAAAVVGVRKTARYFDVPDVEDIVAGILKDEREDDGTCRELLCETCDPAAFADAMDYNVWGDAVIIEPVMPEVAEALETPTTANVRTLIGRNLAAALVAGDRINGLSLAHPDHADTFTVLVVYGFADGWRLTIGLPSGESQSLWIDDPQTMWTVS